MGNRLKFVLFGLVSALLSAAHPSTASAKAMVVDSLDWAVLRANVALLLGPPDRHYFCSLSRNGDALTLVFFDMTDTGDPIMDSRVEHENIATAKETISTTFKSLSIPVPKIEVQVEPWKNVRTMAESAVGSGTNAEGLQDTKISKIDWAVTVLNANLRDWAMPLFGVHVLFARNVAGEGPNTVVVGITENQEKSKTYNLAVRKTVKEQTEKLARPIMKAFGFDRWLKLKFDP